MDINSYETSGTKLGNPVIKPRTITLERTQTAAVDTFFFDDSCGMASTLGLVGGANTSEFDVQGDINAENLKCFLQSYALIVCAFNFQTTVASELFNNLTLIRSSVDGDSNKDTLFTSPSVSAMAQNQNLLNVKMPFIWDFSTAFSMPVGNTTGAKYTLTFSIVDAVPYGELAKYLADKPVYRTNGTC